MSKKTKISTQLNVDEDQIEISTATLSQWQLIRLRFSKHRLAVASFYVLIVLYLMSIFAEFFAPYGRDWRDLDHAYCPPQLPKINLSHGINVNAMHRHIDPITFKKYYIEQK